VAAPNGTSRLLKTQRSTSGHLRAAMRPDPRILVHQERITLATQVTFVRLALLPVLWWWAMQGQVRWVGIGAFGSFLLDILDGHLARVMRQVTKLGGLLDSIADALLLISSVTWLVMFRREILQPPYSLVAAASFGLWFVLIAVGIIKHRRFLNLHLYSGKANGVLGILFIADALAFRFHPVAFYVAFGWFTLSNIESLLVMLTRSKVDEHIGSIFKKRRPVMETAP
jgi:phosphatidylglycerophosphate synthase